MVNYIFQLYAKYKPTKWDLPYMAPWIEVLKVMNDPYSPQNGVNTEILFKITFQNQH